MFKLELTLEALDDLRAFKKREQNRIVEAIETQLTHQPHQETRNRKRLRPNRLAEWELRVDEFRIFYDVQVSNQRVKIEAIGYKEGNRLYIHGHEYQL